MPHPLDGAIRRIKRANNYIQEAEGLLTAFASECEDRIIANFSTQGVIHFPPVSADLPLAVSDAIHNLRAALDYLVYELALRDSGSIQEKTQFPLEIVKLGISPSGQKFGFDVVAPRFLRGLSAAHRDAIERLQPYNGKQWARDLKDISNPDKHRKLTTISVGDTLNTWVYGPHAKGKKLPNGDTVHVDPTHTVFIELPDRKLWVMQTLYGIQGCAIDTINVFRPDF